MQIAEKMSKFCNLHKTTIFSANVCPISSFSQLFSAQNSSFLQKFCRNIHPWPWHWQAWWPLRPDWPLSAISVTCYIPGVMWPSRHGAQDTLLIWSVTTLKVIHNHVMKCFIIQNKLSFIKQAPQCTFNTLYTLTYFFWSFSPDLPQDNFVTLSPSIWFSDINLLLHFSLIWSGLSITGKDNSLLLIYTLIIYDTWQGRIFISRFNTVTSGQVIIF